MLFNPAYFLLNAEVGNGRERRRKWQEVEGKGKMSVGKILYINKQNKRKLQKKKQNKLFQQSHPAHLIFGTSCVHAVNKM